MVKIISFLSSGSDFESEEVDGLGFGLGSLKLKSRPSRQDSKCHLEVGQPVYTLGTGVGRPGPDPIR